MFSHPIGPWTTRRLRQSSAHASRPNQASTSPPAGASEPTRAYPGVEDRQPTILIVEDDVGVGMMLALALEDASYTVRTATNGQEALDMLESAAPHLILLDLRMPVMDGPTFISILRDRQPDHTPPIIIMTAYRDVDPAILELGFPTINKPMRLDVLLRMVAEHLPDPRAS